MIEVKQSGQYKNVTLLTKYKRNGVNLVLDAEQKPIVVQKGLGINESVVLEKSAYAEGKEFPSKFKKKDGSQGNPTFLCRAILDGEGEVGFFLSLAEHNQWKALGGVGDKVKVTCVSVEDTFTGGFKQELKFEKA